MAISFDVNAWVLTQIWWYGSPTQKVKTSTNYNNPSRMVSPLDYIKTIHSRYSLVIRIVVIDQYSKVV